MKKELKFHVISKLIWVSNKTITVTADFNGYASFRFLKDPVKIFCELLKFDFQFQIMQFNYYQIVNFSVLITWKWYFFLHPQKK